ncbi:MAG: hypothetical protein GPJ52_06805 [Candidatus Heimdallarchaeota archaeon]|nr:hypothetical protein [Candidatus Heimdallarchaeota archaeon]
MNKDKKKSFWELINRIMKTNQVFIIIYIVISLCLLAPILSSNYLRLNEALYDEDIDNITLRPHETWSLMIVMDEDSYITYKLSKKSFGSLQIYFTILENTSYNDYWNHIIVHNYTELDVVLGNWDWIERTYYPTHNNTWMLVIWNPNIIDNISIVFDLEFVAGLMATKRWNHGFAILKTVSEYFFATSIAFGTIIVAAYNIAKRMRKDSDNNSNETNSDNDLTIDKTQKQNNNSINK